MKSPSPTSTMIMMIVKSLVTILLFSSAITTTMACRCDPEPTLNTALGDETVSIFRGIVVPSLTSKSNSTEVKEISVLIEKVYRNREVPIRSLQTITIVTPNNSCGVKLPLFTTFLFSGVVAYKNDRIRMLQPEQALPTTETDTIDTETKQSYQLRRAQSTNATTGSTAPVSMDASLCTNYIKLWRSVTPYEKCRLLSEFSVICY